MRLFQYLSMMFFASSLLMCSALAEAAVATFKKVHGVVDLFPAGERKAVPVKVGSSVKVGDTVRTGRRSRAQLKFSDGSVLNIGSLSKIEIGEFSYNAEKKVRKSNIRNLRGQVRAAVSKSSNKQSYFRIQTPGAVAAVRGTVLQVAFLAGVTNLATTEGSVAFTITQGPMSGKTVMVNANQVAEIVTGQTFITVVHNVTPAQMKAITAGTDAPVDNSNSGGSSSRSGSSSNGNATGAASTTTKTTGAATSKGATTTTTTTTVTNAGDSTTVSTTTSVGAPIPTGSSPIVAPVFNTVFIPPPTPPITKTVPAAAVQNANVNMVIQF